MTQRRKIARAFDLCGRSYRNKVGGNKGQLLGSHTVYVCTERNAEVGETVLSTNTTVAVVSVDVGVIKLVRRG